MRRRFPIDHLSRPSLRNPFGYDRTARIGTEGAIAVREGFVIAVASKYPHHLPATASPRVSDDEPSTRWGGSVSELLAADEFAGCEVLGGRMVGGWFAADRVLRAAPTLATR